MVVFKYYDSEMMNERDKKAFSKEFWNVTEMIRNGAVCVGTSPTTQNYRQKCLEQAYWNLCHELAPILLHNGLLVDTQELLNLLDTSAMIQKRLIRPDLIMSSSLQDEQVQKAHPCNQGVIAVVTPGALDNSTST